MIAASIVTANAIPNSALLRRSVVSARAKHETSRCCIGSRVMSLPLPGETSRPWRWPASAQDGFPAHSTPLFGYPSIRRKCGLNAGIVARRRARGPLGYRGPMADTSEQIVDEHRTPGRAPREIQEPRAAAGAEAVRHALSRHDRGGRRRARRRRGGDAGPADRRARRHRSRLLRRGCEPHRAVFPRPDRRCRA